MGRCATCRHWERNGPMQDRELIEEPGEPIRFPFQREGYGTCALGATRNGSPLVPGTLVNALDSEQYAARLGTHETFGCVLHETQG